MAASARTRLTGLHRRLLFSVGRDITVETSRRAAVVFAPHPDDETLGCGATIARKVAAGAHVQVVVAADGGNELRRAECREACRRLGLGADDVSFLGLPDGRLEQHTDELDASIGAILDESAPEDVFAPCGIDAHTDHRALAGAVIRRARVLSASTAVLTYPIWYWNRWAWVDRATPRWLQGAQLAWRPVAATARCHPRVVRAGEFAAVKRHALDAHSSQLVLGGPGTHDEVLDPSWLDMFLHGDEVFFSEREPHGR